MSDQTTRWVFTDSITSKAKYIVAKIFNSTAFQVIDEATGGVLSMACTRLIVGGGTDDGVTALQVTGAINATGTIKSLNYVSASTDFRFGGLPYSRIAIFNTSNASFGGGYNTRMVAQVLQHEEVGGACAYYYRSDGSITFHTNTIAAVGTTIPTRLTIGNTGFVGLNTMTPNSVLDISPPTGNLSCGLNIKVDGLGVDSKNWRIYINGYASPATDLRFGTVNDAYTFGVDYMLLTRSGNLFLPSGRMIVGATTETAGGERLQVTGNVHIAGVSNTPLKMTAPNELFNQFEALNGYCSLYLKASGANNSYLFFADASGEIARLTVASTSITLGGAAVTTFNTPSAIELGGTDVGKGNRYAYIDFLSDDTNTDYCSRILRLNSGVNAGWIFGHKGTGNVTYNNEGEASFLWQMNSTVVAWLSATSHNLIIGASTETGSAERLQVTGTASFGNSSAGANATVIEADGTLTFKGTATVFDDLIGDISSLQTTGSGVSLNGTEQTMEFTTGANLSDYAWINAQVSHKWKAGSDVFPHIHFEQTSNAVPNFLIRYRWQKEGGTKTTAWTDYKCNTLSFTYVSGTLNQIAYGAAVTPPAGYSVSDIIQYRIFRDNSNASGVFTGADTYSGVASITSTDIHYEIDTVGSRSAYTK